MHNAGVSSALGGAIRQEYWSVNQPFTIHGTRLHCRPHLHSALPAVAKEPAHTPHCSRKDEEQQQFRACAGKDRACGQNSIPVRSQNAAQAGAFYICALRLLTWCIALAAAIRKSFCGRALHWRLALAGVSAALGVLCTALWRQGRRYGECTINSATSQHWHDAWGGRRNQASRQC